MGKILNILNILSQIRLYMLLIFFLLRSIGKTIHFKTQNYNSYIGTGQMVDRQNLKCLIII